MLSLPPLSLYIHIPWCVQKCPYCDFNSHAQKGEIPQFEYVQALLKDLDDDIAKFTISRPLQSIFIGGGTPSLFSAEHIEYLLSQIKQRFTIAEQFEVTLEANPGSVESDKFVQFQQAGVTRLSLGIQSFGDDKLIKLGRIHDSLQARQAAEKAALSGVNSFNLDLMHGLPQQTAEQALYDLKQAIALNPQHISWYQLTIEPNTAFYSKPPKLPNEDKLWDIQQAGLALLKASGYQQYEISAFSKVGFQCKHNLNYWQFGDYLGIGCGAHGKITDPQNNQIWRTTKVKHPKGYLTPNRQALDQLHAVVPDARLFEYMMNACRLMQPFSLTQLTQRTGLNLLDVLAKLQLAQQKSLVEITQQQVQVTKLGHQYLNDLLELFL